MTTLQLSLSCPFDLDSTLCCGQAFRWEKKGNWWHGVLRNQALKIRQNRETLEFEGVHASSVKNYFGLHDSLPKILSCINRDEYIEAAIDKLKGLRILRQEPWECLISYICATYKSIPAIKQMLKNLSRKFGEEISENHESYAFPAPMKLARASLKELAACGLGYRAKYVSETSKLVWKNTVDLEHLKNMSYEKARDELMNLPGVGPKVADCVLLFSMEKLESFPVDVWIKRAVLKHYARHFSNDFIAGITPGRRLGFHDYEELNSFGRRYFGRYAGYAQEYVYHYERMKNR